jgi:hypothetical protein
VISLSEVWSYGWIAVIALFISGAAAWSLRRLRGPRGLLLAGVNVLATVLAGVFGDRTGDMRAPGYWDAWIVAALASATFCGVVLLMSFRRGAPGEG